MKNNIFKSVLINTKYTIVLLGFIAIAFQTKAQCPTPYITSSPSGSGGCGAFSNWAYSKDISLTISGSAITDYRLLLTINTQDLISSGKLRNDGGDLRFSLACSSIPYWIESGLNTTTTKVWVKVPTVSAAGTTTIKMYYGNPGTGFSGSNVASNVFESSILALYTFTEGSGTVLHDWVGGKDLNMTGSASWASGIRTGVGSITGFTGGGRTYRADNGPALGSGSFTVIDFIYATNANGSTQGIVGNYNNDGTSGWVHKQQGGSGQHMLLTNQSGGWCQQSYNGITNNQWKMAGARRNTGVTNTLFAGGSSVGNLCSGDARNVNNSGPFEIGRSYNNSYAFSGNISLIAIYNSSLSDAQVLALTNGIYPSEQPNVSVGNEKPSAICYGVDLTVNLSNSQTGVDYQLKQNGSSVQSPKSGTGSPLSWTVSGLAAGNYQFIVVGTNTTSECDTTMTDTVKISVYPTSGGAITAVQPSGSLYTGGVATNLYIGYGADKDTLKTSGFGGGISWSPATYLSCTGCAKTIVTPTAAGSYTYTAKDICQTKTISLCVKDIRVPNTSGTRAAVYLCHKEPVTNATETQAVLLRGIPSHFQNHSGDKLGTCTNTCGGSKRDFDYSNLVVDEQYLEVMCSPNPFRQSFKLHYISNSEAEAVVSIYGMTGNLVEKVTLAGVADETELGSTLPNGIYTVSFIQGDKNRVFRMIKVH